MPLLLTEQEVAATTLFGQDLTRQGLPGGGQVAGSVTLDLCAATYPSEASRVDRVAVAFYDAAGRSLVRDEAVRYSPGASAAAYSELLAAPGNCPASYVTSTGATVSHLSVQPKGRILMPRQMTVTAEINVAGASPQWMASAYQFDGDYLSVVSAYGSTAAVAAADLVPLAVGSAQLLRATAGLSG